MNTTTLRLHRPWWTRAADPVTGAARALFAAWQRWRERRIAEKAIDDALDLDEGTLRDMGAPLWLLEQARARREQRQFDDELARMRERLDLRRFY